MTWRGVPEKRSPQPDEITGYVTGENVLDNLSVCWLFINDCNSWNQFSEV